MILRKPYAFLIKYFKLIHVFLVIPLCYLLYRTNVILNFFQEYISSEHIISGIDFTGELFNTWMFALPFLIILILGILLGVMFYKKKPKVFYIYNVLVMIALLIVYNIGYNMIGILEVQTIETRTLRLMRDVFTIVMLLQGLSLIITFIRATGFDIKKFDFNRDLEKLDITDADAEEFEVSVELETNVFKREFRKKLRFFKYIYVENKFVIKGLFLIAFAVVCFMVYMNLTIYNKTYKQGETFSSNEFSMSISNSYLTNRNHKGNKITDNYLLIIELNIKANYENITLNTAKAELKIKDHTYYPNNLYDNSLIDLGVVYGHEVIDSNNFKKILLVYEISGELINEKMAFKYLDSIQSGHNKMNPKYIKIKLNPYNLDSAAKSEIVDLNKGIELNEKVLNTTSIELNSFELQEKFKVDYKYCNKGNCYDSIEYLKPILNTNYDKALLKIEGQASMDNDLNNKNIHDLYTIINYFGKIKYRSGNKTKYYTSLTRIISKKAVGINSCYIEVPKEIISSEQVSLIIDVRDKSYEYIIK